MAAPSTTAGHLDTYDSGGLTSAPVYLLRYLGVTGPLTYHQARVEFEAAVGLREATSVFTDSIALGREPTAEETEAHERAGRYCAAAWENFSDARAPTVRDVIAKIRLCHRMHDQNVLSDEDLQYAMSCIAGELEQLVELPAA